MGFDVGGMPDAGWPDAGWVDAGWVDGLLAGAEAGGLDSEFPLFYARQLS